MNSMPARISAADRELIADPWSIMITREDKCSMAIVFGLICVAVAASAFLSAIGP